jgi:YYY domain-containing protein
MQFGEQLVFQVDGSDSYVQGPISLDQPVGSLPVVDDARWSADLTSNSWAALLVWVLLLVVLQAAMWPVVKRIFSRFPDRGWAFGRLVTLLSAGYLVWILSSLEIIAFRAIWCVAAIALVALAALGVAWWQRRGSQSSGESIPWFRNRSIVFAELVFWSVFGLFLLYRFINPDSYHPAWGGEKPMEFAHINAILRSAHFPPYDPWYADGLLNYYYYGMYLVAFMMKATGIPSEIAFNLAQPTMMALLAAGAFSLVSAVAASLTRSASLARIAGLIGVVLVSFSGNLVVISRIVATVTGETQSVSDYMYWFWEPTRVLPRQTTIHEFPYFTGTYADLHAHVVALPITMLVLACCFAVCQNARSTQIVLTRPAAFPPVSRDLVMTLGLLALALGTLFVTNAWDVPMYAAFVGVSMLLATRGLRFLLTRIAVAAGLVLGIGLLAYGLMLPFSQHYVALYGAIERTRDVSPPIAVEAQFGVFFLVLAFGLSFLLSRLWVDPPRVAHPSLLAISMMIVLILRWMVVDQSADVITLIDGIVVLLPITWLTAAVWFVGRQRIDFGLNTWIVRSLGLVVWIVAIGAVASDRTAFGLFVGFGGIAALIWLMARPVAERFVAACIAAGMFTGAGVELVFLVDALDGQPFYRMNTVFKFYNGVWITLAVASAALIGWMIKAASEEKSFATHHSPASLDPELNTTTSVSAEPLAVPVLATAADEPMTTPADIVVADRDSRLVLRSWAQVALVVSGVAIAASLAYPAVATGIRLNQHFPQEGASWTLNALDWMDYGLVPEYGSGGVEFSYDEDRDIIEWFNANVGGSPVIAEASINQYACAGSRISVHTGLPVVVGWTWHESQQRDWVDLYQRREYLRTLYTSTDPREKVAILDRYRVEYIVVGDLERHYPTDKCASTDNSEGIATFESMVGSDLEVAFTSGDSIVYRVLRS